MIDPVAGGTATEAQIRAHLYALRIQEAQYAELERNTGGPSRLAYNILQMERALLGGELTGQDAVYEFLKRDHAVSWTTGAPTWDHWQLVNGQWKITTYQLHLTLDPLAVRTGSAEAAAA